MDDLDHSIHIAEYDWTSFYEESEECSLLKPSIACLDSSSLSDSDESENSSAVFSTGQWETQLCPDVNSDIAESDAVKCTGGQSYKKLPVQLNNNGLGGEQDDVTTKPKEASVTQVNCKIFPLYPAGNALKTKETVEDTETADKITNESQSEGLNDHSSEVLNELKKEDRYLQTFQDNSINEPGLSLLNKTELNVNEPHASEGALCEDVSSATLRAEKERWFVTVNDSPAQRRVAASSVKKKKQRRQKKTCKNMCISGQEKSAEVCLEIKDKNEFEGRRRMRGFAPVKQNSGGAPGAHRNLDLSQMSEKHSISNSLKTYIVQPMMDRNKNEPGCSASTTPDLKDPSRVESAESDDGVEFVSVHSCDSESYLSAAESMDEPLIHFKYLPHAYLAENTPLFLTSNILHPEHMQDREMHSCDSTVSCNAPATNCDDFEGTGAEPALTFPSAGQRGNKMPDDNSTCDNNTHSVELCTSSDTLTLQKQEIKLPGSGSSSGHQRSSLPATDLTVPPCSAVSSETYAEAAGHTRPVYAISAFWDEMEKMTINDILQLRKDSSTPPRNTEERVTSNTDDSTTKPSFVVVENELSDGGPMDTLDTADSDYFTQAGESRPECSSCEFSTSDFEEYWQLIGARKPSPDPQDTNQPQTSESAFLSNAESSTCSERKETPVPSEGFAGQCFEDQESQTSTTLSRLKGLTKRKSVYDVLALNTEKPTSQSLIGGDESDLSLSCSRSVAQSMTLEVNDSLETLLPAPVLFYDVLDKCFQISIPEVFEYFFTDNKTKNDSRCVAGHELGDISVAPVFDCSLCTFWDETSFSSLHNSQCSEAKPIPIFSCARPIVRELTFPKPDCVFLSADCEEDDISPVRVVSRSFTQASDYGAGASRSWTFLQSMRKICFHDKGSIWCQRSGAWVFPVDAAKKTKEAPVTVVTEERFHSTPIQLFRELAVQQNIWKTIRRTSKSGLSSLCEETNSIYRVRNRSKLLFICVWLFQDERASSRH